MPYQVGEGGRKRDLFYKKGKKNKKNKKKRKRNRNGVRIGDKAWLYLWEKISGIFQMPNFSWTKCLKKRTIIFWDFQKKMR